MPSFLRDQILSLTASRPPGFEADDLLDEDDFDMAAIILQAEEEERDEELLEEQRHRRVGVEQYDWAGIAKGRHSALQAFSAVSFSSLRGGAAGALLGSPLPPDEENSSQSSESTRFAKSSSNSGKGRRTLTLDAAGVAPRRPSGTVAARASPAAPRGQAERWEAEKEDMAALGLDADGLLDFDNGDEWGQLPQTRSR